MGVKSPKIVGFGRFKKLDPLNKGWPIAWFGYLFDRVPGNVRFLRQTPEPFGCNGDQWSQVLSWTNPYIPAKFGSPRSIND